MENIQLVLWLPSHAILDSPSLDLNLVFVKCLETGGNKVKFAMLVKRTIINLQTELAGICWQVYIIHNT